MRRILSGKMPNDKARIDPVIPFHTSASLDAVLHYFDFLRRQLVKFINPFVDFGVQFLDFCFDAALRIDRLLRER